MRKIFWINIKLLNQNLIYMTQLSINLALIGLIFTKKLINNKKREDIYKRLRNTNK